MVPEITALYAGLLALWQIFLGYRISVMRRKHKVGIGSGGNLELNIAVRCHGNAVEYIPLTMLLILIAELNGASAVLLHSVGVAFSVGRILHTWGLTKTQGNISFGRFAGMFLTWAVLLVMASACIYFFIS
jgi:uncharacterized membrane protein YecN with MAPEG domain